MTLALIALLIQLPAQQAVDPSSDEGQLRAVVQQYYDALGARDPDKAMTFWSRDANPRPMRETFVALFGDAGQDTYTIDIRSVAVKGGNAGVRVFNLKTHVATVNERVVTSRVSNLNLQLWRKEATGWKLMHDGPVAEELADQFIPASPEQRKTLIDENRADLPGLRYVLSMRGSMAGIQKNYQLALTLFTLALDVSRAAADKRGESEALNNVANAYNYLGNRETAIDYHQQRIALAREMDDQGAIADSTMAIGNIVYGRQEYTPALGYYRDALAIYEKRDDGANSARALSAIGNVQYLQAEYDAATASYRRSLTLYETAGDRNGTAFARKGVARVLAAQGDIAAALDIYGRVLAESRVDLQTDPRLWSNVANTLESIGELHFRLGNTDQARATFDEARKMLAASPVDNGRVLLSLGLIELVAGRFDTAYAHYSDSRAQFQTAKNDEGIARAWVGIGFSQTALRKYSEALTAYRTAIDIFAKLNQEPDVARAWLGLSQAQSGAGEEKAALESAEKVRTIGGRLKNDDLLWRGSVRAGEALRKLIRPAEAQAMFTAAIASIDRLAADAPFSSDARGQLEDSASAWAELALTLAKQGDAAGALAAVEARRAHIRRVQFSAFARDITRGETPEEQADEQAIVRDVIMTRAQLRAESQASKPDAARMEKLRGQLVTLMTRRGEQQTRLFARVPALRELRALTSPELDATALTDLAATPGTLLVEYVVTDEELLIVTVARGETGPDIVATATPFDRQKFAETLAAVVQPAALQSAGDWRTKASPLAVTLLYPILARLADRDRIVFVPDDLLWKVPFEALPLAVPQPSSEGGVKDTDLASRATVAYATSLATLLLEQRTQAAGKPAETPAPAFLAAPKIPETIRAQLALTIQGWKEPDAEASLGATRQSATPYGETVMIRFGAEASETAARDLLDKADLVHVSAPLLVSATAPLLSSVILASAGDTPAQDGRWEAREWFASSGRARVAVIPDAFAFAAAGVGGAMDALAWAANAAGISTLVLGRWPADGFVTADLAAELHAQLAKGLAPADAWRAAIAAAREKNPAPSAWAGLRIVGAPR